MANSSSSSSLDLGPGSALSSGHPSSSCCSPRGQKNGSPNRQETWNRTPWYGISHENRELDNHNLFYQTYENLRSPKQEPETTKTQRHSGFTQAEQFSQRGVGVGWGGEEGVEQRGEGEGVISVTLTFYEALGFVRSKKRCIGCREENK